MHPRHDVVHFKGAFLIGDTAEFAAGAGSSEDFILDSA
jgi:hypothetical protein